MDKRHDTMYEHIDRLMNRRRFLGTAGAAGLGAAAALPGPTAHAREQVKSRVAFLTGEDRRDMVYQALKPFEREIREGIRGKQVLLKPNCVVDYEPLCATHPDALRGVLDFLKPICDRPVILGESSASPNGTLYCFEQYGYMPLSNEYNLTIKTLDLDSYTNHWIRDGRGFPQDVKIIDAFLDPSCYIISITRPKCHGGVIATLSLKNTVMASPVNFPSDHPEFTRNKQEKGKMHSGGPVGLHYNIFRMAEKIQPDLSVIDGVVGMEGNGPARGTAVEHGIMLAGTDVVAVDRIAVELMGIDWNDLAYLKWSGEAGIGQGDLANIEVTGPPIRDHVIPYKMPDNIDDLLTWKEGI